MEPVFALQYYEFLVASKIGQAFPKGEGYSVHIPLSRQTKGLDLALVKSTAAGSRGVVTFQVKASRHYPQTPPKRKATRCFQYGTWFNKFEVPPEADFVVLAGLYPEVVESVAASKKELWQVIVLLFSANKMKAFLSSIRQKSGLPETRFGFAFDGPRAVYLVRGNAGPEPEDFSGALFENQREQVARLMERRCGRK